MGKHIDYITAKANSTLGFVRCSGKISNPQVKEHAYNPLFWPILEYSQIVWDPHTSGEVAKIESVQRREACYTLNRYHRTSSVSAMIAELNWQTLADRRRVAKLLMFYKIHYHLVAVDMSLSLSSTYTYREHAGILHTIVIQRLSPQLIFHKNSKRMEYSAPRGDCITCRINTVGE